MIAIVGATGLVGQEIRKILEASEDPADRAVKLFASEARPEQGIRALGQSTAELATCEYLINAATSEAAQMLRELMTEDQILIDNSSAFRMDPEVPLVVPEINGGQLEADYPVIANPNCTAILLCLALNPLREAGIQRVVVSTYQAASGAGVHALEELEAQLKAMGRGETPPEPKVFPHPILMNLFSHNTPLREAGRVGAGYNDEECKVIEETRKILGISHLAVSATCVRVPVRRAHTEAVTVDLKQELSLDELRRLFASAPGLKVVDDESANRYPMPLDAENRDEVLIGRIRKDVVLPRTVHFMIAGDQLRKGAALNAVQIMRAIRRHRA